MWKNENNLMIVYNNIDWTNLQELENAISNCLKSKRKYPKKV